MDLKTFRRERDRLRSFCLQDTSLVVILDIAGLGQFPDPRNSPSIQLAECLLFALTVDAGRLADPDDLCLDEPTAFAVPSQPMTRQGVAAALDTCRGSMPFVIDYRMGNMMWPIIEPHLIVDTLQQISLWDRGLRKVRRIGGLVTFDDTAGAIAINFTGNNVVLRRGNGQTLDLGGFWHGVFCEIEHQGCVQREQWRCRSFATSGNA